MESQILLALAAPPAAGKTEVTRELGLRHGFRNVSASGMIRQSYAMTHPDMPFLKTRSDVQRYQNEWRERNGMDALAAAVVNIRNEMGENARVCFDGLRNRHDAQRIREAGGIIIALRCPDDLRHARFMRREGAHDLSLEAFLDAEKIEYASPEPTGLHLKEVMAGAKITVDSSRPLRDIMRSLVASLARIGVDIR